MAEGDLSITEAHPSALDAKHWITKNYTKPELMLVLEAYSSCAIENNRIGQVCGETLRRLIHGEPVSDRHLLGLAWNLRMMKDKDD